MKVVVQEEWFSLKQCNNNPSYIYVFGDNLLRVGEAGQAQIRSASNSIGIATKRSPSMNEESFFADTCEDHFALLNDIQRVYKIYKDPQFQNMILVFPSDGLGTGLSELPKRSPFLNNQLKMMLKNCFNIDTNEDNKLSIKDV